MPDLVTTVGAAGANSFASLDEAEAYCDATPNAGAWAAETDDDERARMLIQATRDISALEFQGERVTSTQRLSWPRSECPDPDAPTTTGLTPEYSTTIVPQRVKDATCRLALEYLKAGDEDLASLPADANKLRKRTGPLETELVSPHQRAVGIARFPVVRDLLGPLLSASSSSLAVVRT